MKVGTASSETEKFANPVLFLQSLFPASQNCSRCQTQIWLESPADVYHEGSNQQYAEFNALCWDCPICRRRNYWTEDRQLIHAHNQIIPSRYNARQRRFGIIFTCVLILILLIIIFVPIGTELLLIE